MDFKLFPPSMNCIRRGESAWSQTRSICAVKCFTQKGDPFGTIWRRVHFTLRVALSYRRPRRPLDIDSCETLHLDCSFSCVLIFDTFNHRRGTRPVIPGVTTDCPSSYSRPSLTIERVN